MAVAQLETLLHDTFGLNSFRPGQQQVMEALLNNGSALAVFPTGGGKSLCYQLPALLFDGVTLVVSPLIALMKDQIDMLQRRGIAAARLDSSLDAAQTAEVERQLRAGTLKLLYVAPERFNNERFMDKLQQMRIALFAIDEAHCISAWGHNFRPDYLKLAQVAQTFGAARVLALTATATPQVVEDICASFAIRADCAVVTGFHRPNLQLRTTPTSAAHRARLLIERLRTLPPGSGIVYVTLQRTAERVATTLETQGLAAKAYHAGMNDAERTAVQDWWQASDQATVVATIAFGMGIDKADVRYVYHYNLPKSLESYSQEIGRAGRDGHPSVVEVLGSLEDLATMENFAYGDTPTQSALSGLVNEVLMAGPVFDLNLYELANRHDIRQLVLRTALTYLELRGVLRQGTPFYATFKARLEEPLEQIVGRFKGERAAFVAHVFAHAKQGTSWYTIDTTSIAQQLGHERQRIVSMLDYLAEQGWIELSVGDARHRFTCLLPDTDPVQLAAELEAQFTQRENQDIARLQQVIGLVAANECQTNMLLRYFGEERTEPCGHCSVCETGQSTPFPAPTPPPAIATRLEINAWRTLVDSNPAALGHARQQARFLCGLTSPATTKAKLTKHALFGKLETHGFRNVLEWCGG